MSIEGFVWGDLRNGLEQVVGRIGIPSEVVSGTVRHADGWRMEVTTPALGAERDGRVVEALGPAAVILCIPDYPTPDGATLVIYPEDARRMAAQLMASAADADNLTRERYGVEASADLHRRTREAEARLRLETREATMCAEPGCHRQRRFFDEDGIGYCKRHAEKRHVRPTGKA